MYHVWCIVYRVVSSLTLAGDLVYHVSCMVYSVSCSVFLSSCRRSGGPHLLLYHRGPGNREDHIPENKTHNLYWLPNSCIALHYTVLPPPSSGPWWTVTAISTGTLQDPASGPSLVGQATEKWTNAKFRFSLNRPTGQIQSKSRDVCLCVCVSVCLCAP